MAGSRSLEETERIAIVPVKGGIGAVIVKYDASGNIEWRQNFGGNGDDYYTSVAALGDGCIVAGWSNENSFGNGDDKEPSMNAKREIQNYMNELFCRIENGLSQKCSQTWDEMMERAVADQEYHESAWLLEELLKYRHKIRT